jgi:hypothetical protein
MAMAARREAACIRPWDQDNGADGGGNDADNIFRLDDYL